MDLVDIYEVDDFTSDLQQELLDIYEEDELHTELQQQTNIYEDPDDFTTELQQQTDIYEYPDDLSKELQQQTDIYEDLDDFTAELQQQTEIYEITDDLSEELQQQTDIYEDPDDFSTGFQQETDLYKDPGDFLSEFQHQINIYEDADDLSTEFQQQTDLCEEDYGLTAEPQHQTDIYKENDDLITQLQQPNTSGNSYEWQLFYGQRWSHICHDEFIESHYCQPAARGITINTDLGSLYVDFDALTVQGPFAGLRIQRKTFPSHNQKEEIGWYFKDNSQWCEYGSQGSSVNSQDVEQQYNTNPRGSFRFTVGNNAYKIDFSVMNQTNLSTHMRRKVRRRPKFNSSVSANSSSTTTTTINPSVRIIWEFIADEGVWTEYQKPASSLDSEDIEKQYQQTPQGQISFKAGRHSYTLNFSGMYQTNNSFGTQRQVRRTFSGDQENSSTPNQVRWQYKDMDGCWKDYNKGSWRGTCSVSSHDIETQYQRNTREIMNFKAGKFNYRLDFSAMVQTNLSTNTRRPVRRL